MKNIGLRQPLTQQFSLLKLIPLLLIIVIFALNFPTMEKFTQSYKFVDEDEYVTVAYLINKGNRLYTDISTNHQPLPYLISATIQKFTQPNTVFLLIKRHREAIFLWAFLWTIILYFRFGKKAIFFALVFETAKYFTLGNEFLAESLAVYPTVYLFGSLADLLINHHLVKENFWLGSFTAISIFFSLTLALPLFLLTLIRYFFTKTKGLLSFLLGVLLPTVMIFTFINPSDYFKETVLNNFNYAIPRLAEVKSTKEAVNLFLLPVSTFINSHSVPLNNWISWFSTILWFSLIFIIIRRQYSLVISWIVLFLLWGLTNVRNLHPTQMIYQGFHLTPWLGVGFFINFFWLSTLAKSALNQKVKTIFLSLIAITGFILLIHPHSPHRQKPDRDVAHYIQYTLPVSLGRAAQVIADNDDRIIVLPHEVLIYWQSGIKPALTQVTFYEWQYHVPKLQASYLNLITNNPPEFIFYQDDGSSYFETLLPMMEKEKYINIHDSQSNPTFLFIHPDKVKQITEKQWQDFEALLFIRVQVD